MRVCSLLPSATEIVCALGMEHTLVGVSHECDFPPATAALPQLTRTTLPGDLASRAIDAAVSAVLYNGAGLYELDRTLLERLTPDVILTQQLCNVCAVSHHQLLSAMAALAHRPQVVYLEPHSLDDVLDQIRTVATALECAAAGERVIAQLTERIRAVRAITRGLAKPRVLCLEWIDPLYCGGHWMADLVDIAGGYDGLSNPHQPSQRIQWHQVLAFAPQTIVLTCCGYSLARCVEESALLTHYPGVDQLPAVRDGQVYAVDGSAYFSRPGPRIVDSLEILAYLLHPESCAPPQWTDAWAPITLTTQAAT